MKSKAIPNRKKPKYDIIVAWCELRKQLMLFYTNCASSLCKLVKHSRVSLSGKG